MLNKFIAHEAIRELERKRFRAPPAKHFTRFVTFAG